MKKLFINASFHLMGAENYTAKGMLTENGIIKELYHAALPHLTDCDIIDLKGLHVYPGFIDTHTHSFEGGLYSQSLDLSKALSINQILELIDAYYNQGIFDGREQLDAFRFDENKIIEKRFPTIAELDKVCPDLPLVLRRIDGHSSTLNSRAWKLFYDANKDILLKSKDSESLELPESGSDDFILRGSLNDKVVHWFHSNCSEQIILDAYQQASRIALANGITTVHTMVGDSQYSIMHYRFLIDNLEKFEVEFILYPQSFNLKAALDVGATRIGGCILADGALGSYTAALRESYSNKPYTFGHLYHDDSFWHDFISEAVKHKLQVAVHCIGDKAIKQINDVYLKLSKTHDYDLRHQLIHCELTPDDLVAEIVASRAVPVMQPAFDLYWGGNRGFYQKVLGNRRTKQMNRINTFMKNHVRITGGSDWYITELDAMQGIKAAINHHNPLERLNPFEAIQMYTSNAAWLSHDENRLGQLQIDFDADFVVLATEIVSKSELDSSSIAATFKKGKQVYSK